MFIRFVSFTLTLTIFCHGIERNFNHVTQLVDQFADGLVIIVTKNGSNFTESLTKNIFQKSPGLLITSSLEHTNLRVVLMSLKFWMPLRCQDSIEFPSYVAIFYEFVPKTPPLDIPPSQEIIFVPKPLNDSIFVPSAAFPLPLPPLPKPQPLPKFNPVEGMFQRTILTTIIFSNLLEFKFILVKENFEVWKPLLIKGMALEQFPKSRNFGNLLIVGLTKVSKFYMI